MTYVGMPFIRCTEEDICARRIVLIVRDNLSLGDEAPVIHSLYYVASLHPCDTLQFPTNFVYCVKEISCLVSASGRGRIYSSTGNSLTSLGL